jgi:hypothetical protein
MSSLSAEQRADLAERMLPIAANLAVLVHGEGGPEDVAEALAGLDDTEKNALIVVLAGLVDPDRPVGKSLSWTNVTQHAALPVGSWMAQRSLRDHVPDTDSDLVPDDEYVDQAAVTKFVKGFHIDVSDPEFIVAVQRCAALGMNLVDVDALRRWPKKTAENRVNRIKKRYQRSGRPFPDLGLPKPRTFTPAEVVDIRRRSHTGTSDIVLAFDFDVTRETIRAIVTGQRHANYGGPIRSERTAAGVQASRDYMCGHAKNSRAALRKNQLEEVA